jgi:hypothetical protein
MAIAALVSFAILLVAWITAPDKPRMAARAEFVSQEVEPLAA